MWLSLLRLLNFEHGKSIEKDFPSSKSSSVSIHDYLSTDLSCERREPLLWVCEKGKSHDQTGHFKWSRERNKNSNVNDRFFTGANNFSDFGSLQKHVLKFCRELPIFGLELSH